ncbi:MAG: branched-chain amino acid ABC transporter permease [Caldilineaceae bacterium SB0668_bin_21]|nr:branched-chain amino acid ABC transporter permease [Caldilineaceae bacterium SB0668_bin_21]MYC20558.1 branched-chain amino acid ABC transporter permease [Caldilineaceae bacterium SB0662_bin_25]
MENAAIFGWALLWILFWGALGGVVTPRIYARKDLEISQASFGGAVIGAALGPLSLVPLWIATPKITSRLIGIAIAIVVGIFIVAFALADPDNLCVANGGFVISQLANGIVIGVIYGLMALGLTLIFSILGVVSFAHGEFYMIGGMVTYFMTAEWIPGVSPIVAILASCIVTFAIGYVFERIFLRPMGSGEIERPTEYAILVTFGLAFFLQYFTQALTSAVPVKAQRFFPFPRLELPAESGAFLRMTPGNVTIFDAISVPNPRFTAAVLALLMLAALLWFLYRTWVGKALRAVSQDRQAAAVTGINPDSMNTLAFSMGAMLAGLSGASLVQVFSWLPQVGIPAAARSFVIIVLGGMGSLPGAFLGGLIVGLVEAAGTGCIPDATRAAAYIPAYGMVILTLVLLLKPTGLFGREL